MSYVGTRLSKDIAIEELYTVHYFEYTSTYCFEGEAHDFWECVYIDRGEVIVCEDGREYRLGRGEIKFHAPNVFHTLRANGEVAPNLVVLSFSCHSEAIEGLRDLRTTVGRTGKSLISSILKESEQVFSTPLGDPTTKKMEKHPSAPFGSEQLILSCLEQLLVLLLRSDSQTARSIQHYRAEGDLHAKLCAFMQEHLADNLTLSVLARHAGVSASTVKAAFREQEGCGALTYFIRLKMEAAKTYIREGRYNFTEIAEMLGYDSIHYFSRRFRLYAGMSPSEYARSVRALEHQTGEE
ncbi:MAG: helix-turn-helix transcriptional regulator [Clostridia bacterium]|nr:helix-turn-helix transcriptional regulator [Clostridia bacterium]